MSDEFTTVFDIAELLKLNQQTVRNWIDRGELQAIRARRIRVRRSDLDAFIAAGTTARLSESEAGAGQAKRISTTEALAELRSQLDAARGEDDP